MLNILAKSFTTATRSNIVRVRDVKPKPTHKRWLPSGHWFLSPTRDIDVTKL